MPALRGPIPVTETSAPYRPARVPPRASGYVDEEYFIACEAQGTRYETTLNVRRPADGAGANAAVIVEPTHPGNLWPVMATVTDWLAEAGHVSIAVSSSRAVVERLVKPASPQRYAHLSIPEGDGVENEILAGLAALLKAGKVPNIGGGKLILAGYSATGAKVRHFIAAKHEEARLASGVPPYDGYFPGQTAVGTRPGPIPDIDVPVIELQGEREVIVTFARNPGGLTYRRPDGTFYRLYEVPGLAHLDTRDPDRLSFPPAQCGIATPSRFPLRHIWANTLAILVRWVRDGVEGPHAEPIRLEADGRTIARDAHGNALGGVRTPYLDVPIATYETTSENDPAFPNARCDMIGPETRFGPEKLAALYGDHAGYVAAFTHMLDELVRVGWYLPSPARELKEEAEEAAPLFARAEGG